MVPINRIAKGREQSVAEPQLIQRDSLEYIVHGFVSPQLPHHMKG
jgi:hypothetical protein